MSVNCGAHTQWGGPRSHQLFNKKGIRPCYFPTKEPLKSKNEYSDEISPTNRELSPDKLEQIEQEAIAKMIYNFNKKKHVFESDRIEELNFRLKQQAKQECERLTKLQAAKNHKYAVLMAKSVIKKYNQEKLREHEKPNPIEIRHQLNQVMSQIWDKKMRKDNLLLGKYENEQNYVSKSLGISQSNSNSGNNYIELQKSSGVNQVNNQYRNTLITSHNYKSRKMSVTESESKKASFLQTRKNSAEKRYLGSDNENYTNKNEISLTSRDLLQVEKIDRSVMKLTQDKNDNKEKLKRLSLHYLWVNDTGKLSDRQVMTGRSRKTENPSHIKGTKQLIASETDLTKMSLKQRISAKPGQKHMVISKCPPNTDNRLIRHSNSCEFDKMNDLSCVKKSMLKNVFKKKRDSLIPEINMNDVNVTNNDQDKKNLDSLINSNSDISVVYDKDRQPQEYDYQSKDSSRQRFYCNSKKPISKKVNRTSRYSRIESGNTTCYNDKTLTADTNPTTKIDTDRSGKNGRRQRLQLQKSSINSGEAILYKNCDLEQTPLRSIKEKGQNILSSSHTKKQTIAKSSKTHDGSSMPEDYYCMLNQDSLYQLNSNDNFVIKNTPVVEQLESILDGPKINPFLGNLENELNEGSELQFEPLGLVKKNLRDSESGNGNGGNCKGARGMLGSIRSKRKSMVSKR